jgi:hypothetical protein
LLVNRSLGAAEFAAIAAALVLLAGASLLFTQVLAKAGIVTGAGRGTRTFFTVTSWVSALGAVLGWLLVLVELVLGPVSPIDPRLLVVTFGVIAPPLGQMSRKLVPTMADAGESMGAPSGL